MAARRHSATYEAVHVVMVALAQVVGRARKDREACTAVDVQARGDVERLAPMERRRPCDASQGNLSIDSTAAAPSRTDCSSIARCAAWPMFVALWSDFANSLHARMQVPFRAGSARRTDSAHICCMALALEVKVTGSQLTA